MKTETLSVCEDNTKGFYVKGLSEVNITTLDEVRHCIDKGERNRHYAATRMNHHSSRSHTIFRINVTGVTTISTHDMRAKLADKGDRSEDDSEISINEILAEGILNFVDLAGSERVANISEMVNPLETIIAMENHKKLP
jgi:hypothetical protein